MIFDGQKAYIWPLKTVYLAHMGYDLETHTYITLQLKDERLQLNQNL